MVVLKEEQKLLFVIPQEEQKELDKTWEEARKIPMLKDKLTKNSKQIIKDDPHSPLKSVAFEATTTKDDIPPPINRGRVGRCPTHRVKNRRKMKRLKNKIKRPFSKEEKDKILDKVANKKMNCNLTQQEIDKYIDELYKNDQMKF